MVGLLLGQLEHEVRRESLRVAADGLVQIARGNALKRRQVGVQKHFLPAYEVNQSFDALDWEQLGRGFLAHVESNSKCRIGTSKPHRLEVTICDLKH